MAQGRTARAIAADDDLIVGRNAMAEEALVGLRQAQKTLPAKFFYDDAGCRLFGDITQLPEYYLTRVELALLEALAPELRDLVPSGSALVEYGASDETKALLLLSHLPDATAYLPIDVAEGALATLVERLVRTHPRLQVHPICGDFLQPIRLPAMVAGCPHLGFFPGSTIGNLTPAMATAFLTETRRTLGSDARFLVGVDLRKPAEILVPAYDDAAGVTAAFNRNILVHLNREAGADFVPAFFEHRAVWNEEQSRIEMHLVSTRPQHVHLLGTTIDFAAGESIHSENSYKYSIDGFRNLASLAGWRPERVWIDKEGLFSVHLLTAR